MASSIFLLVLPLALALALLSASANFVSIDCGSTDSYTDENTIAWVGDAEYVQNGKSQTVKTANGAARAMGTLREFSTRKKNCYSIKVVKGSQVLVRASFFYGNYDKKSAPPTFDLQLDGNDWGTVETSADTVVSNEVIYVSKGDFIELCLAQTEPNQLPFISAIEIRGLDTEMYSDVDADYVMFLAKRVAYGATEAIRYPSDAYDRIWDPVEIGSGITKVTTDATIIDTSVPDQPPVTAFQYGITTSKTSQPIVLTTDLPDIAIPVYITMYFSEVTQLDSTQSRSFEIYLDGKSISDPIVPVYGTVTEMSVTNITVSSNSSFSLVATSGSTLPPLINAMEVYFVDGPTTDGTDSYDVAGLAILQEKFSLLQEWTGDPCLPSPFTWDWVNCTSDDTPRVTALYLNGYGLSGNLPDFSSLDALQTIDFHNNSLSGGIPDFLGTLPNLKQLNLADNKLSGPIPTTVSKNTKLKLVVTGNPNVCASGESCKTLNAEKSPSSGGGSSSGAKKKSSKLPLILGIAIPAFIVFWVVVVIVICVITSANKRKAAIAANYGGQNGGANNMQQGAPMAMNPQMVGKFGEVMMNQFEINVQQQSTTATIEEQGTPDLQATPDHLRNQDVEERPLHY